MSRNASEGALPEREWMQTRERLVDVSTVAEPQEAPSPLIDLTKGHPVIVDLVTVNDPDAYTIAHRGLLVARPWQLAIKRVMDIAGSLVLLVVLSPVLLVTALAIGLTSPGGVIHRQQRVGRDGTRFTMYKFRSMVANAHEQRHLHADKNHHDSGPIFKIADDPRITPVGRWIRRLSIDELPQLLNVLQGRMSLVGPRPPLPEEFETYNLRQQLRMLAKPGLTCIWQVSGRSDVDFDRWVDMDIEYFKRWTIRLDVLLLLKSIPAVILGRGAY
jgi:lipopolysaccharide/colanic/teichoic acid biosynthesis glycosyltransferase